MKFKMLLLIMILTVMTLSCYDYVNVNVVIIDTSGKKYEAKNAYVTVDEDSVPFWKHDTIYVETFNGTGKQSFSIDKKNIKSMYIEKVK